MFQNSKAIRAKLLLEYLDTLKRPADNFVKGMLTQDLMEVDEYATSVKWLIYDATMIPLLVKALRLCCENIFIQFELETGLLALSWDHTKMMEARDIIMENL